MKNAADRRWRRIVRKVVRNGYPSAMIKSLVSIGGCQSLRPVNLFLFAVSALSGASVLSAQPTITEYALPTPASNPAAIAKGADGSLWITETAANRIARITTTGVVAEFPIPTPSSHPLGITAGQDGNLWFTEADARKIGKITPTGIITEFPVPSYVAMPVAITQGPDGNIWFASSGEIAKVSTAGVFTEVYEIPKRSPGTGADVTALASGPDGNIWFADAGYGKIGKITPSGAVTEYTLPSSSPQGINFQPLALTPGPDGNLWVAAAGTIWRVTTAGAAVEYALPTPNSSPQWGITAGPDGNLWFTTPGRNSIGRLTPGGTFTAYALPSAGATPFGITAGPDGNLWFTELDGNRVGQLNLATVPSISLLTLSATTMNFTASVGGNAPTAQVLTITAPASTSLVAAQFQVGLPWLSISPAGSLNGSQTITVNVDQVNLVSGGEYVGNILLTSGSVTQVVLVTLHLSPAPSGDIKVSPGSLNFNYALQSSPPAPQVFTISNVDPKLGAIPLTISSSVESPRGGTWLSLTTSGAALPNGSSGTSSMNIAAWIDPLGLAPGVYRATITITPSGGTPVSVPVTLTVVAVATTISATPTNLSFTYVEGGTPTAQSIQLTESGPVQRFEVSVDNSLITVTPLSGNTPTALAVTVNPSIKAGNYASTITISLPYNALVSIKVTASLTVLARPSIQEFSLPDAKASPQYITLGPDGNVWFTEQVGNRIGKITPAGLITEYPLPPNSAPCGITTGPDGNLWFTEPSLGRIARMNTSGAFNEYQISNLSALPCEITRGPDGNLWFTEPNADRIGVLTKDRGILEYAVAAGAQLGGISSGSDGNAWFAETKANKIAKITPQGVVTEYALPSGGSVPSALTAGPDGNVWFTEGLGRIGRITPRGDITEYQNSFVAGPIGITAGPDGNLWFANNSPGMIASITTGGLIQGYALPPGSQPFGVAPGVDGNIWFTDWTAGKVGRLLLSSPMAISALVNSASFAQGAVAPGEIVTIGGTNLGPTSPLGLVLDSNGNVATSAGGVTVSFNGYPAPLLYVSASQINCVVPYEIGGASDVLVQVTYSGRFSSSSVKGTAVAAGIFTVNGSGSGAVAAANSTGGFNGPDNPATAGSTITLYLTGEGETHPGGVTGKVTRVVTSSGGPLTPQPLAGVPTVSIGGRQAPVTFYGEAPDMVAGIMQLNVQIPEGLPRGTLPLIVSLGGASSQSGVTVSIR